MNIIPDLRPFRRLTLRQQLTAVTTSIMVVMVLSFVLITIWQTTRQTTDLITGNARQVAHAFADQSVLAMLTGSAENAQTAQQQIMDFPDVAGAALIMPTGEVLSWHSTEPTRTYIDNLDWSQEQRDDILLELDNYWLVASAVWLEPDNGGHDQFQFEKDTVQRQKLGYAVVIFSKSSLNRLNRSILIADMAIGGVLLFILMLVLRQMLHKVTAPLRRLADIMVDAGNRADHIQARVEGAREVTDIALAYNELMQVLDVQEEALRRHRDELEAQVRIRTRELTEARDAALTASRHKSEFLANVSHELRTPIQSIIGYIDLLREELEDEGMVHLNSDLQKVITNAERLLSMINNLLNLARIEAGRMDLKLQKFFLSEILEQVEDIVRPLLPQRNNQFELQQQTDDLLLYQDSEKLLQVLINLIGNACKFTQSGQIWLRVCAENQHVIFEVEDTGEGIEAGQLELIFQQFHQADGSLVRGVGGTGLGLAITRQFVELMQGSIDVKSQRKKGTTFRVTLPVSVE